MACRHSVRAGLTVAAVALLQLAIPAAAEDRMRLGGPPAGIAWDFANASGDRVFFGEGSAELGFRARIAIRAQAAWLANHPDLLVIVEGHADDTGAPEANLTLSRQRAEAVRLRLIESGVAPERIRTVAFGRRRPIAVCPIAACAAQNRRVVTVVQEAPAPAAPGQRATTVDDPRRRLLR